MSSTLRTVVVFAVICILWSLWISTSLSEWVSLWSIVNSAGLEYQAWKGLIRLIVILLVVVTALAATKGIGNLLGRKLTGGRAAGNTSEESAFFGSAAVIGVLLLLMYVIGQRDVYLKLGKKVSSVVGALTTDRFSERDANLMVRGYYEKLITRNPFSTQLWQVEMKKPTDWVDSLEHTELGLLTDDLLRLELRPSSTDFFKGAPFHTNRWGLRDRDYEKEPPPNVYRIALLGGSRAMGDGVANHETFEWLLEERLNRENNGKRYTRYEILNFAVAGYGPLRRLMVLENKVLSFQPDAIFYVGLHDESRFVGIDLSQVVERGVDIPYKYPRRIVRRAGINQRTGKSVIEKRLQPFYNRVISWAQRRIVADCQQQGILPVWIYLPSLLRNPSQERVADAVRRAEKAGFITLNLSGVFGSHNPRSLWITEWDTHPNAKAHRLIADRLYDVLAEKREDIPLGLSK